MHAASHTACAPRVGLLRRQAPDLRAQPTEFLLDVLVAAVDVVDAVDQGVAFGDEAGQGFLHIEREWSPEEIDQRLSKLARRLVHEARHGGHLDGESRRQRLQEICRALGYDYHHLEERPLLATE